MPIDVILIAAVTVDGFIARNHLEVTNWSKDLTLFKKQTTGFPVIMGSNTYKTLHQQLEKREMIIVNRNDCPKNILEQLNVERCFVIGGGKTYSRFSSFLTHLYITPHPLVFGTGVRLFTDPVDELSLKFKALIPVDKKVGIYQYQYIVDK